MLGVTMHSSLLPRVVQNIKQREISYYCYAEQNCMVSGVF